MPNAANGRSLQCKARRHQGLQEAVSNRSGRSAQNTPSRACWTHPASSTAAWASQRCTLRVAATGQLVWRRRPSKPVLEPESILVQVGPDALGASTSPRKLLSRIRSHQGLATAVQGAAISSSEHTEKPSVKPCSDSKLCSESELILPPASSEAPATRSDNTKKTAAEPCPGPESILVQAGSEAEKK